MLKTLKSTIFLKSISLKYGLNKIFRVLKLTLTSSTNGKKLSDVIESSKTPCSNNWIFVNAKMSLD